MAIRLSVTFVLAHLVVSTVGIGIRQAPGADRNLEAQAWSKSPSSDPCTCLTWGAVYNHIDCGAGREHDQDLCTNLFKKFGDENFCVQGAGAYMTTDIAQWCYVSAECRELNNPEAFSRLEDTSNKTFHDKRLNVDERMQLRWKRCTAKDNRLADMEPPALLDLAKKLGVDPSNLAKLGYPVHEGGKEETWEFYKPFYTSETRDRDQWYTELRLRDMKEGTPMLFNSEDGRPPIGIIKGGKVYEIPVSSVKMNQIFTHKNI